MIEPFGRRNVQSHIDPGHEDYASLPVSVLAHGDRRLEAETYLTGGYGMRVQIETLTSFKRFGELAEVWQPTRLKGIQVDRETGVPFLTATQAFDIRPLPRKWLAPSKTPDLEQRLIKRGWLLVTCSGNIGDTTVAFAPHVDVVMSHDLLRVEPRDEARWGYLYAFLRSRFGRTMLRSSQYGSVVKHLEPEHLRQIPVPLLDHDLEARLDAAVREVFRLREQAYNLTRQAEQLYTSHVPIPASEDISDYATNSGVLLTGRRRLDAYHYNPLARTIEAEMRAIGNVVPLSSLATRITLPNRFVRIFAPSGIPYLGSEDIFKINPEITKFIGASSARALEKYRVASGALLVARSGQTYGLLGSVMLASARHEGKIVSEDIIRVVPRGVRPGYLATALGHPKLGRRLILRMAFGSSVPHIAPEDLATVPILRLPTAEDDIASCMEEASALRLQADEREDALVARVEHAIQVAVQA